MKAQKFASVWDAIADTHEEAANLRTRAELMQQIAAVIARHEWTQADAAARAHVTQPRINDLVKGRVSRFTVDALLKIAASLGLRAHIEFEECEPA